jgi:hypothetical protein
VDGDPAPPPDRRVRDALARWRPPTPFPIVVRFWERSRGPETLWTMPLLLDDDGNVIFYLAVGSAGRPMGEHMVAHVDFRGLPKGAKVQILTDVNTSGVTVYGVPDHTMN